MSELPADLFGEIDPPDRRLLMGPGPSNVHPRVLRAMSAAVLGQFDPEFTTTMNQVAALYRGVFQTKNKWTFMIDGTSRAAIEAALVSVLAPGGDGAGGVVRGGSGCCCRRSGSGAVRRSRSSRRRGARLCRWSVWRKRRGGLSHG
jgi:hypothetical protein